MNAAKDRDEWLMAEVAQGKRGPLETLVRRHASSLLSFIHRMVGDRHRSEEIFQEVFLAVWNKRTQYQFPRPFKPWLYAIAINKCSEHYRRQAGMGTISLHSGTPVLAARGPSPVETAIATETAALVSAAVGQLPVQQRAVVVLRVWQGLSYAEIATILERSEGTARSLMHHGLCGLRKYLEPKMA